MGKGSVIYSPLFRLEMESKTSKSEMIPCSENYMLRNNAK